MILYTGAGGGIAQRLAAAAPAGRVLFTSSSGAGQVRLDLTAPEEFDDAALRNVGLVVHAAAASSPDICRNQPELAHQINVAGAIAFIETCLRQDKHVIFFSSDTVYGDRQEPFHEDAETSPAGSYAAMKHAVERHFQGRAGFKAFRLSYVVWNGDKFTRYLRSCLQSGRPAELFDPFCRSAVHVDDLLQAVNALHARWDAFPGNVLNVCGPRMVSRAEMAEAFSRAAGGGLQTTVTTPEPAFFTNRPRYIHMCSRYFGQVLGHAPTSIDTMYRKEFSEQEQ